MDAIMSFRDNISFKVGCAPINEPVSIEMNGVNLTVSEGYFFTLKLFEGGTFRFKTTWHVTKEESQQPDFKKQSQIMIQEHKKFLTDHFKNWWIMGGSKIISIR